MASHKERSSCAQTHKLQSCFNLCCHSYHSPCTRSLHTSTTSLHNRSYYFHSPFHLYSSFLFHSGEWSSWTFMILEEQPYNAELEVEKKDCVGHVQKRMGTAFAGAAEAATRGSCQTGRPLRLTGSLINNFYSIAILASEWDDQGRPSVPAPLQLV